MRVRHPDIPYYDEQLSQYILDAYASANESIRCTLTDRDKWLIKRIASTTLEQKLYLCGKLGKRFAIVVADRGRVANTPFNVTKAVQWFKKRVIEAIGTTLKHWGIFIRGDKEIIQSLSRLSMDISPKTMYLLRNYEEIALGIEEISNIKTKVAIESQCTDVVDNFILKYSLYRDQLPHYKRGSQVLTKETLPLLFYFSQHKDRYIPNLELAVYFGLEVTTISKFTNDLFDMGYVQIDTYTDDLNSITRVYQLTGYGLLILNQIRDKIVSR
jgi:DNA-binding MarR family transcriptional regulator